jgi:hypothetical protein
LLLRVGWFRAIDGRGRLHAAANRKGRVARLSAPGCPYIMRLLPSTSCVEADVGTLG